MRKEEQRKVIRAINLKLEKIQRKLDSQISQTKDILDDIFTKTLNSSGCIAILFNCLKNLEAKMREISVSSEETTESQIKGEKQLSDLTKTVI